MNMPRFSAITAVKIIGFLVLFNIVFSFIQKKIDQKA